MKVHKEMRKKIYEATIAKLQQRIKNVQDEVNEAQQMANEYGPPKDRYDGFRMQLLRKKDILSEQLENIMRELEIVKRIELQRENPAAGLGAMVVTDNQKLFIAVGLGNIEVDGEKWHVVSTSSPIAGQLQGKKAGDTIVFMGKKTKIQHVF